MTSKHTELQNWYQTHSTHLKKHPSFEFLGGPESGINHLIYHQLPSMQAPVWFEVTPRIVHDPVLTSNALVDAFNKASGERVLDHGMHYPYVLNIIKRYTPLFGQHTFIFSGADLAPEFAQALLDLQTEGHHVILIGEKRLTDLPLLTAEDLRLTREEALALVDHLQVNELQVREALEFSKGLFEKYWIKIHQMAGRQVPLRPTATGMKNPPGYELDLEPRVLVPLLCKREKYLEALEIAALRNPELVLGFIEQAGTKALLTGSHDHLHVLLESLPQDLKEDEVVMRWRIEAACLLGKKEEIKEEVLRYLDKHEAPDVRAVAVLQLIFKDNFLIEADRALKVQTSIHTLKAKTFLLAYEVNAVFKNHDFPFEALAHAEESGNHLESIRCIKMISIYCNATYRFNEYYHWTQYGLDFIRNYPDLNAIDHLSIINSWIFSRILQGKFEGIKDVVDEGEKILLKSNEDVSFYFKSTIAHYNYLCKNYNEVIAYWKEMWESADRNYKAFYSYSLIRSLVASGRTVEACEYSQRIKVISRGLIDAFRIHALIAIAFYELGENAQNCLAIVDELDILLKRCYHSQVYLVFLVIKYCCEKSIGLRNLLDEKERLILNNMPTSVLKYYISDNYYDKYINPTNTIKYQIKSLGRFSLEVEDKQIKLPLRQAEILVLLSAYPEGLSGEKLMMMIYGDDAIDYYGSLKTTISKLRKFVNIGSGPYRILNAYESDVLEILDALENGDRERVIGIYSGDLLPESDVSEIKQLREYINEAVKSIVLSGSNIEDLIKIFEYNCDIEILQAILLLMDKKDPRYPIYRVKMKTVYEDVDDYTP